MYINTGSRIFLFLSVAAANLLSLVTGLTLAWSSPVIPKLLNLTDDNPLSEAISPEQESWIGSLLSLGAVIGPFPFGYLSQKIGRKFTLISIALPYTVGYVMAAFAESVVMFFLARIITGIAVGGMFGVLPNYLAEISDTSVRGLIGASINIFLSIGLVLAYVTGPYISIMWFSLMCAIIPVAFAVTFFVVTYDSPYYLMEVNEREKAEKSLSYLRNKSILDVQKELEDIKETIQKDKENAGTFLDVFKSKGTAKGFIIANLLMLFQQMSGINIVLFYAQKIFMDAGTDLSDEIPPMIIGGVQLVSSFITPSVVDRLGRKMLLLISAAGMAISQIPLGLYFYLKDEKYDVDAISWLPILTLVLYMITYNCGFGPLPWTVMAEILPSNLKASTSSVTAAFCWFIAFLVTKFFHNISEEIGIGGSFWIFAGLDIVAFIVTWFYVPETKGKSFQEIQAILSS